MVKGYTKVLPKESIGATGMLHRTKSTTLLFGLGQENSMSQDSFVDPEAQSQFLKGTSKRANPSPAAFSTFDKKPPIPKNKLTINRNTNPVKQRQNSIFTSHRSKSVGRPKFDQTPGGQKAQNTSNKEDKYEVIELFRRKPYHLKGRSRPGTFLIRENSVPNLPSMQNLCDIRDLYKHENSNHKLQSKNSSHTSLQEYYNRVESQHRLRARSAITKPRSATPKRKLLGSTISREEFHFSSPKQKAATNWKSSVCQTVDLMDNKASHPTKPVIFDHPEFLRRFQGNPNNNEKAHIANLTLRSIGTDPDPPPINSLIKLDAECNQLLSHSSRAASRGTSLQSRGGNEKLYSKFHDSVSQTQTERSRSRGLRTSGKGNRPSRYLTDVEWRIGCSLNIYVFRNGVGNESPLMIHIPPNRRKDMASIFGAISERIKYSVGYIFALYGIDGTPIFSPAELEMNHYYVVASNLDKQFKSVHYGKNRLPLTYLNKSTKHAHGQNLNQDLNWCFKEKESERNDEEDFQIPLPRPTSTREPGYSHRHKMETTENVKNLDWKTKYDINRNYEILENIIPPPTAFADY